MAKNPHPWGGNLRTIELDGEPWFVASDVCRILFKSFNPAKGCFAYVKHLAIEEKTNVTRVSTPALFRGTSGGGRVQVLSESGLYKLIMRSDKDTARPFQDWVTRADYACSRIRQHSWTGNRRARGAGMDD